ncbi:kinesin-like protein KIF6 isoform X1 [Acipenser oxyrinchus oxyrinchus]|uniref:Kinesin-like protein n=1 Tax=Acipenser oxyrinchus oxyrinchus TaxID=40147 RepID=A0AAD8GBA0_ACIOX|nr:kinesin-like protein KIF6 isoform X1 [Acipenser oxyrinchus oxyrinchus]
MVKQTIQIFARIKPTKKIAGVFSVDDEEHGNTNLEFLIPHDLADGFVNNKKETYRFKFQKVFDQGAKQEDVFENIAKPVADSVLSGYNGTIFAYGQTGSGKTFTITGGAERYSDRGIIPRTLSYLFQQFQKDSTKVYTTHISYLEIYNECGYDLLDPRHEAARLEDLQKVSIMEDPEQNIHLKNLSSQQAANEEEALNLLFLGDTNRMIAETPMNQASTRSHCIFTIHVSSREPGSATVRHSKLHLVDLAGSERVGKTGVGGQLLTEAKYINLSLHYLEQVIIALSEKNRSHIPYRNSMMTSVLRDSLGGNCMTTMIATLSVEKRNIDESISTCRFAQRVALIKNEAVLNEELDPGLMIIRLKREILALKDELAMVTGEQRTDQLTEDELQKLEERMEVFLEDSDPEAALDVGADMRKIQHCFQKLKILVTERRSSPSSLRRGDKLSSPLPDSTLDVESDSTPQMKKLKELLQQRDNEITILVNMLKKEKKRAQDAVTQLSTSSNGHSLSQGSLGSSGTEPAEPSGRLFSGLQTRGSLAGDSPLHHRIGGEMSLGRQEAFEIFRRDHVDIITIEDNKALLKQRFAEAKALGEKVKLARVKVNELKAQIEQRRMQRAAHGVISSTVDLAEPDPVEEELRVHIEEEKKSYKATFGRLKGLKTEIEHLQLLLERAKVKLQRDFEVWWSEEAARLQPQEERSERSASENAWRTPAVSNTKSQKSNHKTREFDSSLSAVPSASDLRSFNPSHAPTSRESSARSHLESRTASTSSLRAPGKLVSPIPLTGDQQTDADILAFVQARQSLLQRKGGSANK